MEIAGKVAVVTGAASGIGRATARMLAAAGAAVVVADVDDDGGRASVALATDAGGTASFVHCDVTDHASIAALFDAAVAAHGGLDIVHNNVGIPIGPPGWPSVSPERLALLLAVNLGGPVLGTRLAIDHLRARGGGAIVNTASIAANIALAHDPAYSASKAGVAMFTRSCASLAAEGIRVNAVLPGLVDTAFLAKSGDGTAPPDWVTEGLALNTILRPEAVAEVVLDLIRDDTAAGEERIVVGEA